ncbi:MAG: aspartate carbamoyltransferase [Candidatus Heimdallarchaeota archaeon]|nr:aspartate carbamoyltransferase [Candidatus Heimdallarchaeota archaeon]MCK5049270.1 aspartate carbamoyltransferase [Candidatus Heimdallarchaeota archaeon]
MKYKIGVEHIVSIKDLTKEDYDTIMDLTEKIKAEPEKYSKSLEGKILGICFFEPSTRTRLSFESAMLRLGGKQLGFSDTASTSVKKGEVLYDTIKMLEGYTDAILLRHPNRGSGKLAQNESKVPIVSGGTGTQEHPTQSLLDMFTVKEHFGRLDNLKIAIMGDLKYGRTIPSLIYSLAKYSGNKIYAVSHELLRISKEVKYDAEKMGMEINEIEELTPELLKDLDVLYVTRVQRERFPNDDLYNKVRGNYIVTKALVDRANQNMIVLHPLPRVDELDFEIDGLPQAKYFDQAQNGVYTRMAILLLLIKGEIDV